ncbi:hypothetical protein HDU98_005752 [Podochytrium sp. JEL0797]|nr:hypothetical protein HDU98_005752 [Podochytrium sp. JEL0797]
MGFMDNLNQARTQVYVISFVCFLCPGMFNALNSLPTAGPSAQQIKDQQNAALYLCFTIVGLLAGGLNNIVGPRILAAIGGSSYAVYAGAQYNVYKSTNNGDPTVEPPSSANAFSVATGALVGIGAGMLWAAQGQICLTYPTEGQKGTFYAIFWVIFNLGAVLGNTIGTILAWPAGAAGYAIGDAMYLVFIVLMAGGCFVAILIRPPGTIIREDQTQVETPETNVLREFVEVLKLFTNPMMLTILVPCMASNWFYTYQFGPFGAYFSGRTNGLKAIFYWLAQAVGAWGLGNMLLDNPRFTRTRRACTMRRRLDSKSLTRRKTRPKFIGPFLLYFCYGLYDAFFQVYVNYLIGAVSNDSETLSRYAGFYKGTQSAANGFAWALNGFIFTQANGNALTTIQQFWVMTGPCAVSCIFFALYVKMFVKDFTDDKNAAVEAGESK